MTSQRLSEQPEHGVIDLGVGHLQDELLPWPELGRAAAVRFAAEGRLVLQYAPEQGEEGPREAIAGLLRRRCGVPVRGDDLMITAGASHGLDLVLSRYTRPGDTVLVEDPSYFFGLEVLRGRGLRLVPVPMDAHGLDVDALEHILATESPRLLYTIPVFHNPTGVTLAAERRRRLAELAHAHDFLIVADEVYQLVGPEEHQPEPMRCFDTARTISLGSFSKIFGPGLRLGWVEASTDVLDVLVACPVMRSAGGSSPVVAAIMQSALEGGVQDEFLDRVLKVYDRRRQLMVDLLHKELPKEVEFLPPRGGYYAWLRLPDQLDAAALLEKAADHGVAFKPGPDFSCSGSFQNCLRVCCTFYDEPRLELAARRLGSLLHAHVQRTG